MSYAAALEALESQKYVLEVQLRAIIDAIYQLRLEASNRAYGLTAGREVRSDGQQYQVTSVLPGRRLGDKPVLYGKKYRPDGTLDAEAVDLDTQWEVSDNPADVWQVAQTPRPGETLIAGGMRYQVVSLGAPALQEKPWGKPAAWGRQYRADGSLADEETALGHTWEPEKREERTGA